MFSITYGYVNTLQKYVCACNSTGMFFTVIFIENKYIYSNLEVDFIFFCFLCKKYIQSSFYKCPFSIKSHCWLGLGIESKILSAKSLTLLQDWLGSPWQPRRPCSRWPFRPALSLTPLPRSKFKATVKRDFYPPSFLLKLTIWAHDFTRRYSIRKVDFWFSGDITSMD